VEVIDYELLLQKGFEWVCVTHYREKDDPDSLIAIVDLDRPIRSLSAESDAHSPSICHVALPRSRLQEADILILVPSA
jgi:hypothetical protein